MDDTPVFRSTTMPTRELGHLAELDNTVTARVPEPRQDVARPAYLAHIVLQTNRMPEMCRWWRTVLGGAPTMSSKAIEFITFDDEHHRVAILERGTVREKGAEPDTAGLHHVAFSYASLDDLVATYRRLKAEGILPIRTIHHGITVSNYYLDPDNNRVELQINAHPNNDALNEWFATRAFNDNPIGILFDFEDLAARYDAGGTDVWELIAPGNIEFTKSKR